MMVLLLAGISTLFLGASAAYLYTRFTTGITAPYPPVLFYLNIPILFLATRHLRKVRNLGDALGDPAAPRHLAVTLVLTLVFVLLQVIGWLLFFDAERSIGSTQSMSYLFLLSGLHLAHVLAGFPFLVVLIRRQKRFIPDLLSPPVKLRRYVWAVTLYWNFLDVLWILLVILLTASALLS